MKLYEFKGLPLTPLELDLIVDELHTGPKYKRLDFLIWVLEQSIKKHTKRSMRIVK